MRKRGQRWLRLTPNPPLPHRRVELERQITEVRLGQLLGRVLRRLPAAIHITLEHAHQV